MTTVYRGVADAASAKDTPTAPAPEQHERSAGLDLPTFPTPPPSPRIRAPPPPIGRSQAVGAVGQHQHSARPLTNANCIAVLNSGKDLEVSTVRYLKLDPSQPPQRIRTVCDFHFLPDCTARFLANDFYAPCAKAALKNRKALHKLLSFLSGPNAAAVVGRSACVECSEMPTQSPSHPAAGLDRGERERVTLNIKSFSEVTFGINSHDNSHFLSTRGCSTLKTSHRLTDFTSVHIVSGICLFSQQHLGFAHGEHSIHCPPLPHDTSPTMYELEALLRLSSAIADTVSLLSTSVIPTITLDIPRIQYYAPVLTAFSSGHCTRHQVEAWLAVIGARHDKLATAFPAAVRAFLSSRGITNVRVEVSTALDVLLPYISSHLSSSSPLQITSLLKELVRADPTWASYLSNPPPADLEALSKASYSYTLLRPALCGTQGAKPLLLHIDNPAEWRIFSEAQKAFGRLPGMLLGLYPLERVFTAETTGRSSLYLQDPGQMLCDGGGKGVGLREVLGRVYGTEKVQAAVKGMC